MKINNLVQKIREEVPQRLLVKSNSLGGDDLHKVVFSFLEIKDILYSVLKDIEIEEVNKKWK